MERIPVMTKEQIKGAVKGVPFRNVVLLQSTSVALTKNNKEYIAGSVLCGTSVPIKAWGSSSAFTSFKENDFDNLPVYITGTFDDFGGSISLIVETVAAVEGYDESEFLEVKYDIEGYWTQLRNVFQTLVKKEEVKELADKILFNNEDIASRFKMEFAAKSHHDNCLGGLLAHTYKVLNNVGYMLRAYPKLKVDSDIVLLGALLHDIGKIKEMKYGSYQELSFVTHRYFGIELVEPFKQDIINIFGEKGWYEIVSVMLQHHGEYDDACRTVTSLLVFKADLLDAELTPLCQVFEDNPEIDRVKFRDWWLSI